MKLKTSLFIINTFWIFCSCGQTNQSNVTISQDYIQAIYDTCHVKYINPVPYDFWLSVDDTAYYLNRSVDSILYFKYSYAFNDIKYPNKRASHVRVSEINKCVNLGFLEITDYEQKMVFDGYTFPAEIDFSNFPELRYVEIQKNITEKQLNDLLCTAKRLKGLTIVLSSKLPDCICELDNLRYLNILSRSGADLPDCMSKMNNLKYLNIYGSGIGSNRHLNDVIWTISSLELLEIDGGSWVDIRPSVAKMNRLKQLIITSVDSVSFSNEFKFMDSLELFSMNWINKKINLPDDFSQLKQLQGLSLNNVITNELPNFELNSKLQYMSLLRNIEEQTDTLALRFSNLPNLKYLQIGGLFSEIAEIPSAIYSNKNIDAIDFQGFGFSYNESYRVWNDSINENLIARNFYGNKFNKTFTYYKWLFILGEPAHNNATRAY